VAAAKRSFALSLGENQPCHFWFMSPYHEHCILQGCCALGECIETPSLKTRPAKIRCVAVATTINFIPIMK